jgi:hypothetical protein
MLELFFKSSGILHMEFIPEGANVNKHNHKEIGAVSTEADESPLVKSVQRKQKRFYMCCS